MAEFNDINEIPDSYRLPKSTLILTLGEPEWGASQKGNRQVTVPCTIEDVLEGPDEMKGREHSLRITIGSEKDPDAAGNDTWFGKGGRDYKKLVQAVYGTSTKLSGNPEDWIAGVAGYSIGAVVDEDGDYNRFQYFPQDQEPPPHAQPRAGTRTGGGPRQAPTRAPAARGPLPQTARGNGAAPAEDTGPVAQVDARPAQARRPAPPPRAAR